MKLAKAITKPLAFGFCEELGTPNRYQKFSVPVLYNALLLHAIPDIHPSPNADAMLIKTILAPEQWCGQPQTATPPSPPPKSPNPTPVSDLDQLLPSLPKPLGGTARPKLHLPPFSSSTDSSRSPSAPFPPPSPLPVLPPQALTSTPTVFACAITLLQIPSKLNPLNLNSLCLIFAIS
jgi:hypothetical protein